jgi:hypothetical protein
VRNSVLLYSNPNFPFPDTQKRPRMPAHELAPALPPRCVVRVFFNFFLPVINKFSTMTKMQDFNP